MAEYIRKIRFAINLLNFLIFDFCWSDLNVYKVQGNS